MATVTDNFNRADNPTSLGVATTGQTWVQVAAQGAAGLTGNPYGILSNQGFNAGTGGAAAGDSLVVVETGMNMTRGQFTVGNADAGSLENLRNYGILWNYVDDTHYIFLCFARAAGGVFRLYIADGGVATHRGPDCAVTMNDGDTMGYAMCGQTVWAYHNGVIAQNYPITFTSGGGFVMSDTLLMGTRCGLQAQPGTSGAGTLPLYDNFSIESNSECLTYDCTESGCVLNVDGLGEFTSLVACQTSCEVAVSYNCQNGICCDPGDGSGEFETYAECIAEGCEPPETGMSTVRFDQGQGNEWWIVAPIVDSGDELRSKCVKPARVTGRLTNASLKIYTYDVGDEINVANLEDGTGSTTGAVALPNSTNVAQSPLANVNCPNAVLSTIRVDGNDTGNTERDQVHEILYQQSVQGVRR